MTKKDFIASIEREIEQLEHRIRKEKERLVDLEGMVEIDNSTLYRRINDLQKSEIEDTKTIIVVVPPNWLLFQEQVAIITKWAKDTSTFSRYDDPIVSVIYTKI